MLVWASVFRSLANDHSNFAHLPVCNRCLSNFLYSGVVVVSFLCASLCLIQFFCSARGSCRRTHIGKVDSPQCLLRQNMLPGDRHFQKIPLVTQFSAWWAEETRMSMGMLSVEQHVDVTFQALVRNFQIYSVIGTTSNGIRSVFIFNSYLIRCVFVNDS